MCIASCWLRFYSPIQVVRLEVCISASPLVDHLMNYLYQLWVAMVVLLYCNPTLCYFQLSNVHSNAMLQDLPTVNTEAAEGQSAAASESGATQSDGSSAEEQSKPKLAVTEENQ